MPNKTNPKTAALLAELFAEMKRRGVTQTELARLTGTSDNHISKLFNKYGSPSICTVLNVADALELDVVLCRMPVASAAVGGEYIISIHEKILLE